MSSDVTQESVDLIKNLEGFSSKSYVDASGHSIGYGHFIKPGEEHLKGKSLSKGESEDLLKKDIASLQSPWMEKAKGAGLNSDQILALTSFAYNTGGGAIPRIIKMMKSGDMGGATELLESYNKAYNPTTGKTETPAVLEKRRAFEAKLLRSGGDGTFLGELANKAAHPIDTIFGDSNKKAISKAKNLRVESGGENLQALGDDEALEGDLKATASSLAVVCSKLANINAGEEEWLDRLRQEGTNQWAA